MINLNVIKNRRKALGYTLEDIAQRANYRSANGYWRIECGLTEPSSSRLILIAQALEMAVPDLLVYQGKEVK
ncbi:MAG: Helix-turn-helix domain [Clostridia bacterium]|jgi:transcriptional regulator with XRE-family HTH domain|nr:Helix-turn-helix domain [Clostridia bacterium]